MGDTAIEDPRTESQDNTHLSSADLKFTIALLNYALFSCPVDGGIDLVDGTTASRIMIEDVKRRLENGLELSGSDLELVNAVLDYSLFACSVDNGIDIGDGVTADREKIEALKKRVVEVLAPRVQPATGHAATTGEPITNNLVSEVQRTAQIADGDIKAIIAVLDYSLFTCPDEGIDVGDGTVANRETIENLKRQLEEILAARHEA